jgi:D-tyrosyl-tRNA(Tyr) deacylase
MRVVLQRVAHAVVLVDGETVAEIGPGYLLLVGIGSRDADDEPERMAEKVFNLRVFEDAEGKMNRALSEAGGEILVVSQFTLYGDVRGGRRPSWSAAAPQDVAQPKVEELARALEARGASVKRGVFGAHMQVDLRNDGPVTLVLDPSSL